MKDILIRVTDVEKTYKTDFGTQYILNGINCEIYKGDFTVIMGASGSGKSTLIYCLSGIDSPTGGSINFLGQEITGMSSDALAKFRCTHCGFVFQHHCLIDGLSVMDNVLVSAYLQKGSRKEIIKKADRLFERVGINEVTRTKYPSQISGGKAQRVGIVRSLINSPEVLFADEPTGSLNSKSGIEVLDTFTDFNREGQSIIMVTHDVRAACRANRILYLKDGKMLGECKLDPFCGDSQERSKQVSDFLTSMEW